MPAPQPATPRPRPPDWPARLATYLAAHLDTPFAWGRHDCATFGAGWLLLLDYPPAALERPWQSALGVARLLRRASYADYLDACLLPEGALRIPPAQTTRGDLVLIPSEHPGYHNLGIVTGSRAFVTGPTGCHPIPFHHTATAAFRV